MKRNLQLARDDKTRLENDLVQVRKEFEDEKAKSKGL